MHELPDCPFQLFSHLEILSQSFGDLSRLLTTFDHGVEQRVKVLVLVGRWFLILLFVMSPACSANQLNQAFIMLWGIALSTTSEIDRSGYSRQYELCLYVYDLNDT